MSYIPAVKPYCAQIYWEDSVVDPALILTATTPDNISFRFNWFWRWIVRLLGNHIEKKWKKAITGPDAKYATMVIHTDERIFKGLF